MIHNLGFASPIYEKSLMRLFKKCRNATVFKYLGSIYIGGVINHIKVFFFNERVINIVT